MKKLHLWFKYLASFTTFFVVAISLALLLFHQSEIPQNTLKAILEYQLDNTFQCEVEVGKLSGNFVTHVALSDVRLHNHPRYPGEEILSVKEAHLYLNPLAVLFEGGNLLAIARKIVLDDIHLSLVRDAEDQWNLLHLPKPVASTTGPSGPLVMPKISTVVEVNDLFLTYRDEKGWAAENIPVPFVDVFYFKKSTVSFDDKKRAIVTLNDGLVGSSKSPIAALGGFDIEGGRFDISFSGHVDMDRWGKYVLPVEGLALSHGISRVRGRLRSKTPIDFSVLPFWYTLGIDLNDTTFDVSVLPQPITDLTGTIILSEGMIPKAYLEERIPTLSGKALDLVWSALQKTGFLDQEGHVLHTFRGDGQILGLPSVAAPYRAELSRILKQPPSRLFLDRVEGQIAGIPMNATGYVGLSAQKLDLMVRGRDFPLRGITRLFPALSNWRLSGTGDTDLRIFGPFENIDLAGTLYSDASKFYAFEPSSFWLDYAFDGEVLDLSSAFSSLYSGELSMVGDIDFRESTPTLNLILQGSGMSVQSVFPSSDDVSGNFGFHASLSGEVTGYDAAMSIYSQGLSVFNQDVKVAHTSFWVSGNEDVESIEGYAVLNGGGAPLTFTGQIEDMVSASIALEGAGLWAKDVTGFSGHGFGSADLSVQIDADLIPEFWEKPLTQTRFLFEGQISDYPFEDHVFDTLSFDGVLDRERLVLNQFEAVNDTERAQISGTFYQLLPEDVSIQLDQMRISNSKLFQSLVPEVLKPIGGALTTTVEMGKLSPSSRPSADSGLGFLSKNTTVNSRLRSFGVSGNFKLMNGYVKNQPISELTLNLMWDGAVVGFDQLLLIQGDSRISLDGEVSDVSGLSLSISEGSTVSFEDFKLWTSPYGDFQGQATVSGEVQGSLKDPKVNLMIGMTDFSTPYLSIDDLTGQLILLDNTLTLKNWKIREKSSFLTLDGSLGLSPLRTGKKVVVSDLVYDVNLMVDSAELETLLSLADGIRQDVVQRLMADPSQRQLVFGPEKKTDRDVYRLTSLLNPESQRKVSLTLGDVPGESLSFYDTVAEQYRLLSEQDHTVLRDLIEGQLSGHLRAKSRVDQNPLLDVSLQVDNSQFWFVSTDQLKLDLKTESNKIAYRLDMTSGRISGIPFDYLKSGGVFDEMGVLTIDETVIRSNDRINKKLLSGTFPLQAYWDDRLLTQPMSLNAHLEGNNLAILSFLNRDISRLFNQGSLTVKISGPLSAPVLNASRIDLTGAGVQFDDDVLISSPIRYQSGSVQLKNNRLELDDVRLSWTGTDTLDKRNYVSADGTIVIRGLSLIKPDLVRIGLDLALKDTELSLNFTDVYRGKLSVSDAHLKGDYLVGLSQKRQEQLAETIATVHESGPQLSGQLLFQNGDMSIPKIGAKKVKPSILLDLKMSVGDNVSVVGGILGDNLLAGLANYLDIRLNPTDEPLLISGTLNAPKLDNTLTLEEGSMTFLNRGFELLNADEQQTFFQNNQFNIRPHLISFQQDTLEDGTLRLNPQLQMSAYTVIESLATENVVHSGVVMLVNGSIYNLDEIVFEKYEMSTLTPQRGDPEYIRSFQFSTAGSESEQSRDTYEVLRLLMPELVGADLENTQDSTQGLLEVVGENQINSYLRRRILRPIERQIAKNVGLYDLRVDYNVGRALIRGSDEDGTSDTESIGVAFVKGLSRNLFLKVRTNVELQSTNTNSLENSNIELQYNLLNNLSLSYSNGKERHEVEANPKFSLRYSHEF